MTDQKPPSWAERKHMCEFIKRQDVIDIITKQYGCESDRLTAIQNLPVSKQEYYGWIFIQEALPPQGEAVLIAYKDDDDDIEYFISKYDETTFGGSISIGVGWQLPQYYKQSCVKAWRKIPVFVI